MDHQIKKTSASPLLKQFLRFNLVGAVNTAVTYLLYVGLILLGMHHLAALAVEYAVGIGLGFVLNRRFTFDASDLPWKPALGKMILTYLPLLAANAALLFVLADLVRMDKLVAQAVSLVLVAASSFVLQKIFVFRKSGVPHV